jgi:hypothetical protein
MNVSENKLPPRRYSSASPENRTIELLIDDLEELEVLYRTEDDLINIPDIFRVGFEIRRKGGVRPPVQKFHKRSSKWKGIDGTPSTHEILPAAPIEPRSGLT